MPVFIVKYHLSESEVSLSMRVHADTAPAAVAFARSQVPPSGLHVSVRRARSQRLKRGDLLAVPSLDQPSLPGLEQAPF